MGDKSKSVTAKCELMARAREGPRTSEPGQRSDAKIGATERKVWGAI